MLKVKINMIFGFKLNVIFRIHIYQYDFHFNDI